MNNKKYFLVRKTKLFFLSAVILLSLFGAFSFADFSLAETRIDTLDIQEGEVKYFTRDNNPYIVKTGIFVLSGGTLKIEKGVVIKFEKDASISVDTNAALIIDGNDSDLERVILTSYNNKNVYAEFSGPDNPKPADWTGIIFDESSRGNIRGAHISYGDALASPPDPDFDLIPGDDFSPIHSGVISIYDRANVDVIDTTIANNYGGISNYGKLRVANSEIYDNEEYGIWSYTHEPKVETKNVWWGFNSGPGHQTLNPEGQGNRVNSNVLFDPWELRNPPVIIIPGILGSWTDWRGEWVLDPIQHTYDNLVNGFRGQMYKEGENLFPFAYDWRKSNVETAKLLKDKIDEAKQKGKTPRVDVVAHSMGGLVARQYIESDEYENDVQHLITLGTPHQGSPNAYLMLEGGIVSDEAILGNKKEKFIEKLKEIFFFSGAKEEGYFNLREYIREKFISVKDLLPTYNYLRDAKTLDIKSYPDNYPRNEFLENLNSPANLEKFHNRPNLKFLNLVGVEGEDKTVEIIRVGDPQGFLWPHGYPEGLNKKGGDHGLELGDGDGTVPLKSVSDIGSVEKLPLTHHELATETFDRVYSWLNGASPKVSSLPKLNPFSRFLFFHLYSPIDFQIVDPQGKKIGKDFATGEVLSEIPYAFYSGFNTDLEFITIPDPIDGEYKLIVEGVEEGEYEIKISLIDENRENVEEKSYQGQVEVGDNLNFKVEYNQSESEALTPIVNTDENYNVRELMNKISEYHRNGAIKDVNVKNYLKHLIRGVQIGEKRIIQVQSQLDSVEEKLSKPDLKPKKRRELEYLKWLYEKRVEFHQEIIRKNLKKFIEKINQYQPNIIEPEAASNLIKMAQNILARYL